MPFSIPLSAVLILFGIFLLVYIVYSLFNIFHLIRFGFEGPGLYFLISTYTTITAVLLIGALAIVFGQDWTPTIELGNLLAPGDSFGL